MSDSRMRAHNYSGSSSRPFSTTAQNMPAGRAALIWNLRTIFQHVQSSIESPALHRPTILHHLHKSKSLRIQPDMRPCQTQRQVEPAAQMGPESYFVEFRILQVEPAVPSQYPEPEDQIAMPEVHCHEVQCPRR